MTDENNQIKFFLYENWARTKTGQHTVHRNVSKLYVKLRHFILPSFRSWTLSMECSHGQLLLFLHSSFGKTENKWKENKLSRSFHVLWQTYLIPKRMLYFSPETTLNFKLGEKTTPDSRSKLENLYSTSDWNNRQQNPLWWQATI